METMGLKFVSEMAYKNSKSLQCFCIAVIVDVTKTNSYVNNCYGQDGATCEQVLQQYDIKNYKKGKAIYDYFFMLLRSIVSNFCTLCVYPI